MCVSLSVIVYPRTDSEGVYLFIIVRDKIIM